MSVFGTYYFGYKMPDYCEFGGDPNPDTSVGVHVASTQGEYVWLEVLRWDVGKEDQIELEACGAAFDLETAKLIAAALNRWIAAHDKGQA